MEDLEDDVDPNILLDYFTFSNIPRRSGRKPSYDTWVRSLFVRNKIRNHPKKEYIRCQLIRGHKRINRNILKGKNPNKTINTLNHSNKESIDAFKDLTDVF